MNSRRNFIQNSIIATLGVVSSGFTHSPLQASVLPPSLKPGDTIALICPAHPLLAKEDLDIATETLNALGFKVRVGKHVTDRYGYLAGKDKDRAADVNEMFSDKAVQGIIAIHGGWGCARILPYLDYDLIKKNPKVLMGYSDITALLNAIYTKTGLVTFHGPVASSTWNSFTVDSFKKVLIDAEKAEFKNPTKITTGLVQTQDRIQTISSGIANGELVGGNLTVLSAMVGSSYLPNFKGKILFLEDIGESIYRIDRMLTHLKLAGILEQISGFIWGKCSDCPPEKGFGSLTFDDLFNDHIKPLGIPAFSGSMIGHITDKFTIPIGLNVTIDAEKGSITFSSSAVRK